MNETQIMQQNNSTLSFNNNDEKSPDNLNQTTKIILLGITTKVNGNQEHQIKAWLIVVN